MKNSLFLLILLQGVSLFAQKSIDKLLKQYNDNSVPYISVQELAMPNTNATILDSRELKEYETSHLKNAIHVGYDHFKIDSVYKKVPNKESKIVVYCSVGIRSESIADSLKKAGYTHVENLYGGIFEWKSNDFPVYNREEKETDSIHTFNKVWSKWLKKGIKVYE
ncbi:MULTISPECIES: rhodanese-like domain-containing protein [unclassified Algibacter]|uniref:rhodanese-like domain-containing protein n=1 Tax=unclassified Algibacter TaxID=2615009 RepID=UPI00131BC26A|nr:MULTISPECIES: rhodanese-like domain-containing protein [unclassified Algibacter]MCL5128973.1 rhodanese-like domain-containing protein [Algibacter sp. L4_22]